MLDPEFEIARNIGRRGLLAFMKLRHLRDDIADRIEILVRCGLAGEFGRTGIERFAHHQEIADGFDIEIDDGVADVPLPNDEALFLKLHQGFAQRRAADTDAFSESAFRQTFRRTQPARQDHLLEPVVSRVPHRLARLLFDGRCFAHQCSRACQFKPFILIRGALSPASTIVQLGYQKPSAQPSLR